MIYICIKHINYITRRVQKKCGAKVTGAGSVCVSVGPSSRAVCCVLLLSHRLSKNTSKQFDSAAVGTRKPHPSTNWI